MEKRSFWNGLPEWLTDRRASVPKRIIRVVQVLVALPALLLFAAYAVDEFFFSGHRFTLAVRKSQPSPWNALLGLLIVGLPSLIFAMSGKGSLLELFIRRDREEPPR